MVLSGVQGVNSVINGIYLPTRETGQDGRTIYRKIGDDFCDDSWCIEHYEGEWQVKVESDRFSDSHVASVDGGCALEDCRESNWRVYNSKGKKLKGQNVKILTEEEAFELEAAAEAKEAKVAAKSKAAAEAKAAAILKDNQRAADIFISGVKGRHQNVNGLYLPTQQTGQDGRMLYRRSGAPGDEELCIEHCEGEWRITNIVGWEDYMRFAYVEGGCALEDCCLRTWKAFDSDGFVDEPSVRMVTGEAAKSQASDRSVLALEHTRALPSVLSWV